jgi:hypothetical protein
MSFDVLVRSGSLYRHWDFICSIARSPLVGNQEVPRVTVRCAALVEMRILRIGAPVSVIVDRPLQHEPACGPSGQGLHSSAPETTHKKGQLALIKEAAK